MNKDSRKKGAEAEKAAALWIEKNKGYRITERNYKRKHGEIDIIAEDGDTCVFTEVKYRSGTDGGYPAEAVTVRKQESIIRTAAQYMQENDISCGRFDVAEIIERNGKMYIRYIENAFEWRNCQ